VLGRRQLGRVDAPLRLEALRQVGVGIQRDAVGPQLGDLAMVRANDSGVCLRQAVDQVGVDRLEAQRARASIRSRTLSKDCTRCTACCTSGSKSCTPKLMRLKPSAARCQALGRGGARVDLDRDLGAAARA
jgi:Arc/MetJ family transcription regulator